MTVVELKSFVPIRVGDVVRLKSGGCEMVVAKVAELTDDDTANQAFCLWHNEHGEPEETWYPLCILVAASSRRPS